MKLVACSQFFLDKALWDTLRTRVLPALLATRPSLRAWSAGCYTGKEAYSLVILLDEFAPGRVHRVLATERDAAALERARAGGPFTAKDVENLGAAQLARYFEPGDPPYYVRRPFRERLELRQHDLVRDPFERAMDLILYRNVEPFFTPEVRQAMYRKLYDALRPGGVLFLGAVERIPRSSDLGFRRIDDALYERVTAGTPG